MDHRPGSSGIVCDQAVFTCMRSAVGQGYRILATSPGLQRSESAEIATRAPSGDGLCGDAPGECGVSFSALSTGRYALLYSVYAGKEPTGRGGQRTLTRAFVFDAETLAGFHNNPFDVLRAIAAHRSLDAEPDLDRSATTLPQVPLVLRTRPPALDVFARAVGQIGDAWIASILERLLAGEKLVVSAGGDLMALAETIVLSLPSPLRPVLPLSVNLRFSVARMARLNLVRGEAARVQQLARGREIGFLDLESAAPHGTPARDPDREPSPAAPPRPAVRPPALPPNHPLARARRLAAGSRPAAAVAPAPAVNVPPRVTDPWALAAQRYLATARSKELVALTSERFTDADIDAIEQIGGACVDLDNLRTADIGELIDTAAAYANTPAASPLSEELSRQIVRQARERMESRIHDAGRDGLAALWHEMTASSRALQQRNEPADSGASRFADDLALQMIMRMSALAPVQAAGMVFDAADTERFVRSAGQFDRIRADVLAAIARWAAEVVRAGIEQARAVLLDWHRRFPTDTQAAELAVQLEKRLADEGTTADKGATE